MQTKLLQIDFLYLDLNTCERCKTTDEALAEALSALSGALHLLGYTINVRKINMETKALAEKHRFLSSPTIRVNGRDICAEVKESDCADCGDLCGSSVNCRVFLYEGREYDQPSATMIADGILRALYGKVLPEAKAYILPDNLNLFFSSRESDAFDQSGKQPAGNAACCCASPGGKCC